MDIQPVTVFPTEDGIRLKRWFLRHYPNITSAEFYKLCRTGQVRINGGRCRGGEVLHAGDAIRIPPIALETAEARPIKNEGGGRFSLSDLEALRKCIIHDDDDIVVFNKPAGLAVQGGTNIKKSLDKMAAALFPHDTVLLVHRLDRETSGIVVCAKNQAAAQKLAAQFQDKSAAKEYLCLVHGDVRTNSGTLDNFIVKGQVMDESEAAEYQKTSGFRPQRAITSFKVLGRLPGVASWLSMSPKTGRNHQLRLHAAKTLGAPIVGDDLYGTRDSFAASSNALKSLLDGKNLFLCAHKLSLKHPRIGKIMTLRAEVPEFMRIVAKFLEFEIPE